MCVWKCGEFAESYGGGRCPIGCWRRRKDTSMTAEQIVDELSACVKGLGEKVQGRSELSIGEAVLLAMPLVRRLGELLVGWLCEVGSRYDRAECPKCGRRMRRWGHRPRTVMTWFGPVRLRVPRLRCGECGEEASPLLERSRLRCGCTPEVWTEVVEEAAGDPYREVEARLARFGIEVSDSTVEALVKEVGGELSAREAAEAEAAARLESVPHSERCPERLYVSVDMRSVRVDGDWREVKVAAFGETPVCGCDADGEPPKLERVSSFSYFGGVDEFMRRVYVELVRRGVWQAREVVLVADGAAWIWDRLPGLVPLGTKTVEVLDFYHAAENLQKAVTAVYGEDGAEGRAWFEALRDRLRRGLWRQVTEQLAAWAERPLGSERQKVVANALAYFRGHRHRMRYLGLAADGYQIGSGVVESQCKRLGQRIKGPGMNWTPEGLAALLAVNNHCQRQPTTPLAKAA